MTHAAVPADSTGRRTPHLLAAACLLLGVACGVLLWSWVSGSPRQAAELQPSVAALQSAVGGLGQRIDQLAEAVAAVSRLSQPMSASAQPRQALPAPAPGAFVQEVQRLHDVVSELRSAVQALSGSQATEQAARGPLNMPVVPANPARLEALLQQPEMERDLGYFGWTWQQVLDAFGQPERLGPSPGGQGIKWYYRTTSGEQVIFWGDNGRVYKVID